MIYHLYFKSYARAYNLKLYDKSGNDTKMAAESQLFSNSQGALNLITLEYKNLKLVSQNNTSFDKKVYIESVNVKDYQIDIVLTSSKKNAIPPQKINLPDNCRVVLNVENNSFEDLLTIKSAGSDNTETFTFVFHYIENRQEFIGTFTVNCLSDNNVYEIVLDFGSEACQMLIKGNEDKSGTISKLFDKCAKHFYGLDKIPENTYDQQDDDDNLFRSIFFPSQNRKKGNPDINPILSQPGKDDPLLNFITERDDSNKGNRLPNIKISNLSGENPDELNLKELHQGIVMRFIHEAVMKVEEEINTQKITGKCGIRLHLLVPNVMSQEQLSNFIDAIRKYTDDNAFRELLPTTMQDVVFDIHSYSESDASFISWLMTPGNNPEKGDYLIIDVGKGTTDFSIIKVEDQRDAVSIYRSGFIGAGNALSYAIFVNYVVSIWGMKAERVIEKVLKESEDAMLYRLESIIEKYKKESPTTKEKSETDSSHNQKAPEFNDKTTVETIINTIENWGYIDDHFGIIEHTIHQIIRKIVVNVKETQFDKVILSGRAFYYKPFLNATKIILSKLYEMKKEDIITLDNDKLKTGCLSGPLSSTKVSQQSDIIGIPIAINSKIANSDELEDDFNDIIDELKAHKKDNGKKWYKRIFKCRRFSRCCLKIFQSSRKKGRHIINLDANNDAIKRIMRGELKLDRCDKNTRFYISDDEYIAENNQSINGEYTVFFDGKEFYVRDQNNSIELTPQLSDSKKDMLYESLFPYPYRILGKKCHIPNLTDIERNKN